MNAPERWGEIRFGYLPLRIRNLFGQQPLPALYDFPRQRDALDRNVVVGRCIVGVELDDGLSRIVELDGRIPVERRAVVGDHRAAGFLRRVCRSIKLRRGLIAQRRDEFHIAGGKRAGRIVQIFSFLCRNRNNSNLSPRSCTPQYHVTAFDQINSLDNIQRIPEE